MRARGDHFRVISGFGPSPLPPSSPLPLLPRPGQLSFLPCVPASRRDGRVALRRRPPRSSGAHAAQSPRLGSGPGRRRCPAVVGERLPAGNDHGRNCHLCEKVLKERGRARRPEILPLRGCHPGSSHSSQSPLAEWGGHLRPPRRKRDSRGTPARRPGRLHHVQGFL